MKHQVLYRESPAWEVPESGGKHYPGDYPGIVIAVRPEGHRFTAGDMGELGSPGGSGVHRKVVTLDLSEVQVTDLHSRKRKFTGGDICLVTFEDRWGALADQLDAKDEGSEEFDGRASVLLRSLPPTIAHSGVGLYEIGSGKTYSTIQSALDQLWIDQGAANFTATQELRLYDGTYTEKVTVNSNLKPSPRYKLKVSAAAGNTAVVSDNQGLGAGHTWTIIGNMVFTGITVKNYYGLVQTCLNGAAARGIFIDDCSLEVTVPGGHCIRLAAVSARNTVFICQDSIALQVMGIFEGCEFYGGWINQYGAYGAIIFRGCLFDGSYIRTVTANPAFSILAFGPQLFNCTVFNVATFLHGATDHHLDCRVMNCIFHTVSGYVFSADAGTGMIVSDSNLFHACTKIGRMNGTDYTALADWQAFVDENGNSPDADSLEEDPLLTNPSGDDFSLQAGSPCRSTGRGSGVISDYLGTVFDPNTPDIGAWSSGVVSPPGTPAISASDNQDSDSITITVSNAGTSTTRIYYKKEYDSAWIGYLERTGNGAKTFTGLSVGVRYMFQAVIASLEEYGLPSIPVYAFCTSGSAVRTEIRQALGARLVGSAALVAAIGGERIYYVKPPKGVEFPCVTYMVTSDDPTVAIDEYGKVSFEIQIDVWSQGDSASSDAEPIVDVLDALLSDWRPDTTSWLGLAMRRTSGGLRLELQDKEQRPLIWALRVVQKGA